MSLKFFLNWDIFGYMPSFNINNNRNFKTFFGSLISSIVVMLIIACIWEFGREIIYKITPHVIEYLEHNPKIAKSINLTNDNFILGFTINKNSPNQDDVPEIITIDNSLFNIKVNQIFTDEIIDFNNTLTKTLIKRKQIKMKPCNNFANETIAFNFLGYNLANSYCLDFDNNENYNLKIQNFNYKNYISFEVEKCANWTDSSISIGENITCKEQDIINSYVSSLKISFFIYNPVVNPSDYFNPLTYDLVQINEFLNPYLNKEIELLLSQIEVQSEVGWLMENIETIKSFELQNQNKIINLMNSNLNINNRNDKLIKFILNLSNDIHIVKRLYIKVQTIAANLGGIIKFLLLLGELIVYYFSKIEFKEFLVNIFFDETISKKNENIFSNQQNILNSTNHPINKVFHQTTNQM